MNFEKINQELRNETLILKPISQDDRTFINSMFSDPEIKKFYIVPNEARQDFRRVVDYWLDDNRNRAGTCWIITKKGRNFFSKDKKCGFVAFEFRGNIKNARISYAILPQFRRKGIATSAVNIIINKLKNNGVESIEADIDRDNLSSEKLVEKLEFIANRKNGLIDPDMMRDGEIRIRTLWKKSLVELNHSKISSVSIDASPQLIVSLINQIVDEINLNGQQPKLMTRYFYLLGRIKFIQKNYDEAQEAFKNCNIIILNEGLPENNETLYWFGRIHYEKGDWSNAKMYYGFALEKAHNSPEEYMLKQEVEKEMTKLEAHFL
ncbi:GNAT family N-acetyltransferase [Haliscomenobacter hydrossis]|uniref:GCN5-related N-acetyltransferase n=1 Tax=Haliscomenobacter hydrossis (strain ATCC 27775 / DSM 1100 / LMG 10767 / O) TaxID=760192 RepID=F4KX89_HALH1|nr:GNAT family N-acetyltransferase [Haliscomenobacter hydrossis]AEE48317.1 GCN5-related N-acetyltransferase [Haliscomenobacter hydrossis DSM 1100]